MADKKKGFRIYGRAIVAESGKGIPSLIVEALDKDLKLDDNLGSVITDKTGNFEINYTKEDFQELWFDKKPDIYLRIRNGKGNLIYTTKDKIRYSANETEKFIIRLPKNLVRNELIRERHKIRINNKQFQELIKYYSNPDVPKDIEGNRIFKSIIPQLVLSELCADLQRQYNDCYKAQYDSSSKYQRVGVSLNIPEDIGTSISGVPSFICIEWEMPNGMIDELCIWEEKKIKAPEEDETEEVETGGSNSNRELVGYVVRPQPAHKLIWNRQAILNTAYMLGCSWAKKLIEED